jgi:CRP/FNR family cyclic AMP-dependent transcriptional regulator
MNESQSVKAFADNEVIFKQNDAPGFVYVVRSGSVRIYRELDGKSTTLGVIKPGEMFGEMAVFSHKPRSASAQAVGATECTLMNEADFKGLAGGPEVWTLLQRMSQRIREVDERLEKLNVEALGRQDALSRIRLSRSDFV